VNPEQRDALRERNARRRNCPRCGNPSVRDLTETEIARRDDTLAGIRYRTCGGCGHTWSLRGRKTDESR
jgi:formate dehydrogenase maturation protein FdhE